MHGQRDQHHQPKTKHVQSKQAQSHRIHAVHLLCRSGGCTGIGVNTLSRRQNMYSRNRHKDIGGYADRCFNTGTQNRRRRWMRQRYSSGRSVGTARRTRNTRTLGGHAWRNCSAWWRVRPRGNGGRCDSRWGNSTPTRCRGSRRGAKLQRRK